MIQAYTRLNLADNSGAKQIMCFKVLGGTRKRYATLGDVIVASVKDAINNGAVKKKEIVRAVIVRTKKAYRRKDGTYIRFDDNAAVIIDKNGEMKGTRILGPIAREVKERGYNKIASLAREVL